MAEILLEADHVGLAYHELDGETLAVEDISFAVEKGELDVYKRQPSKYSETTVDYKGQTVPAVSVQDSDAPTLLYLSNASGENGGYYIYDAAKSSLYRYQTVSSTSRSYIMLEPDGSVPLPDGFTETTITIDDKQVKAWAGQDAQGTVYLIYCLLYTSRCV